MDDEDEVREMNLSSRPVREERRREREIERIERGRERCARHASAGLHGGGERFLAVAAAAAVTTYCVAKSGEVNLSTVSCPMREESCMQRKTKRGRKRNV